MSSHLYDPWTHVIIDASLAIPLSELKFRFTLSSGPGGQHVNKAATQVELLFDVARSPSLNDAQRQRILRALERFIDSSGVLHLTSQSTRSQLRNRQDVSERFQALLHQALKPRKKRRATKPTAASREQRLEKKKRRGATKRSRRTPTAEDVK
ncbi:MAG TPA: alternative ribosome rescue aminoacyl-tRNA hydrolase ArfB [Anaerolineae bacterium]|nr:alternative ribosome rescue aminoacyl-tRNA hydrolase ArfB [Anaerolineae bacterium]